jgi:hypothetical protein
MVGMAIAIGTAGLQDPTVTSNGAMYFFYKRTGRRGTKSSFETDAAVDTGNALRSEVGQPALMARAE